MKKQQTGAVIVEAVLVLPLVFFLVVLMIFVGNLMLIRSNVESIVTEYAIKGSNMASDPILYYYEQHNKLPSVKDDVNKPYRYIISSFGNEVVGKELESEIKKEIKKNTSIFSAMEPKSVNVKVSQKNHIIASSFNVHVDYKVNIPWISLFDMKLNPKIEMDLSLPNNDTPELIRNTDMVIDYIIEYKIDEKASNLMEGLFSKFKGLMDFVK